MTSKQIIKLYEKYVMPTYFKYPLAISRAQGSYVWDAEGKKYLDFFPGWAVSGIGHCHPLVVKAIKDQSDILIHIANNYYHEWQGKLAEKIVEHSFSGKVFFCNSGAEANEGAIKLARKWGNPRKNEIITLEGSFHGRTIAAVTATGQKKFSKGFEPIPKGFKTVAFNNIAALKRAVSAKTAAIMIEPIQGEGGVRVVTPAYLKAVRALCDQKKILLVFDEVQSGMGRTGQMFAYQNFGVEPDIMTLAKTLGGGFPIGAFVAKKRIGDVLGPGTHGSTFGGSPLACAASLAVFEAIEKEKLLGNVWMMGVYLQEKLHVLEQKFSIIKDVRGIGLMVGVELSKHGKSIYEKCLKKGLLINCTQGNVLRIMPPITVTSKEIDKAISILADALKTA